MSADAPRMSRRRMVVASGAAVGVPLVLAACGTTSEEDERSEANDPELLNAVLAQHLAILEATQGIPTEDPAAVASEQLMSARRDSVSDLEAFVAERDGEATTEPAETAQAESRTEALALQLQDSIEASLEVIGDLSSPAYRQAVHRFITEDAAALAALRSVTGDDVAPDAFVFGAPISSEGS
ncbi:MAG: hypothetical protein M3331_01995 [Actinomycetota bacterium]|nr:hypothetical protein [Actinomycetota bacterium]